VPTKKVNCAAFSGADLGTLFITTSRYAETASELVVQPTAGDLCVVTPCVKGILD
jgi:sugar lactone lactonase YvrE